jgi:hypothetical protein
MTVSPGGCYFYSVDPLKRLLYVFVNVLDFIVFNGSINAVLVLFWPVERVHDAMLQICSRSDTIAGSLKRRRTLPDFDSGELDNGHEPNHHCDPAGRTVDGTCGATGLQVDH